MRSSVTAILVSPQGAAAEPTGRSDAAASPGIGKDARLIGKRYEVQRLLGQGGMGSVYQARDRLTGQLVALKRVAMAGVSAPNTEGGAASQRLPESAVPGSSVSQGSEGSTLSGPRALRVALAQEFRTLASLRHPNIVSVLDYGFDHEHMPFFTMEYLERPQNLLLASLQLPLAEKLELIAQLLRALTYLHRHAIVHRDLKPSNILVVREADALRLKVLDFGIAVQVGATRDIAGTTAYMAPEVRRGEAPAPTSDLYAVGLILYQMLIRQIRRGQTSTVTLLPETEAGEQTELTLPVSLLPPPAAESQPAAHSATDPSAAESEYGPIGGAEWAPDPQLFAGSLAAVVARLVDPDPRSRYQDAAAVLHDLSQVMSEIAARPLARETVAARDSFLQAAELVGRERELAQLASALAAARRGTGGVILVGGESGVGKSRLLDELRTTALVHGVRAMRGQAVSDGGTAYQIFSDVLPQLVLELPMGEMEASVLKELVSELPTLLGRSVPDAVPLSPHAAQQRLYQVLLDTLTGCPEPVVLLLEDLHWAAPESLALLKELAEQARKLPLLIVASYRDDERADLPQLLPAAAVLKLPRLTPAGIAALSYAMLGEPGTRPGLVAFLERETEGNVFFIIEVVRALAEEAGSLAAVGTRELPQQVFAGGVSAVVQRRLRRVPDWARPLLRAVAVAGRQVDMAVFRVIEPRLADWLQVCLEAAVLEVNDAQWRFSHDKLREALLAALSPDEKRRLHRQVGETIEQVHGATGAHEVALAFHFEQAGDLPKAARLTAQAGTSALRRGALHEAATLLARAESLEEQVDAPLLERTATMRRRLRASYGVDRRAECLEICLKGMALLGRPIPETPAGRMVALLRETGVELRNRIVGAKVTTDEQERALAKELLSLIKTTGDVLFGRLDVALLAMLFSLHAAEQIGDVESQTNHLSWLGYAAYCLPLHRLGKLYLEQAAELLRQNPQSFSRSDYHPFVGYMHQGEGNWDKSIEAYTVWLNRVIETKDAGLQCLAYCSRSSSYFSSGRLAAALSDAERCLETARRIGNEYYIGVGLACRALVIHFRGDVQGAHSLACESRLHLEQASSLPGKLSIYGFTALAALRIGERERALESVNKSVTLMAKTFPPSAQMLDGYAAALEVALHFFLYPQSAEERAGAENRLLKALYHQLRYAHKFPVAGPRAVLTIARILWSRGHARLAQSVFAMGLNIATRRRMPYEQALAHLWLGRLALAGGKGSDQASRARRHLDAAEKLFSDGGYCLDLPEVRSLLSAVV